MGVKTKSNFELCLCGSPEDGALKSKDFLFTNHIKIEIITVKGSEKCEEVT